MMIQELNDMQVIEFRGLEYPRQERCSCKSLVKIDYTDVEVEDEVYSTHPIGGWNNYREIHKWICPICGCENKIIGRYLD